MPTPELVHLDTITAYHRFMELSEPENPLISVVKFEDIQRMPDGCSRSIVHNFYTIALKKNVNSKLKYGYQAFDFDEGVMHMMSPMQVLTIDATATETYTHTGWLLLIHPDFLYGTSLSKKIKQYEYFNYNVQEALHLSEKEESMVVAMMQNIALEYHSGIDVYSQDIIIAQVELLLTYTERFYQRQFITRKIANHKILHQLDVLLTTYFNGDDIRNKGIPTVQFIAENLNISPNYLSRLLTLLTGQSTKQFIHDKLIDIAKEKLSTTDLSVNEIAYTLGFEHPQSFSKLFKSKSGVSPVAFRQSFN